MKTLPELLLLVTDESSTVQIAEYIGLHCYVTKLFYVFFIHIYFNIIFILLIYNTINLLYYTKKKFVFLLFLNFYLYFSLSKNEIRIL